MTCLAMTATPEVVLCCRPYACHAACGQAMRSKGRFPRHFYINGIHPMFASGGCDIAIEHEDAAMNLWTGQEGHKCMQATAIWEETQ